MDTTPYKIIPIDLASRAISLASEGVDDVAWTYEDAWEVIGLAERERIGVLGGDVWIRQKSKYMRTYDSWYCDISHDESPKDYVARSCKMARSYLENYPKQEQGDVIFVLVFQDS